MTVERRDYLVNRGGRARAAAVFFATWVSGLAVAQTTAPAQPPATPATPPAAEVAPPPPPPPPPASPAGTVRIGGEIKKNVGKVLDVEKADSGCYISARDDKGDEFIELGLAAFCIRKPPLKGQRLEFVYKVETVPASECAGNPKCKKTETLPVIVEVKPAN